MRSGWRAPADRDASARHLEHFQTLLVRQKASNRRHLAHLDRVAIQTGEDLVKACYIATIQQRLPAIEVPQMWLASHRVPEPLQVALDRRTPFLKAQPGQVRRQPTVQPPRAPLGAAEV